MTIPKIPCQRCQGTRVQDLPKVLHKVLEHIQTANGDGISVLELHRKMPGRAGRHPTAINRRVERLVRFKLVEQANKGKRPPRYRVVG